MPRSYNRRRDDRPTTAIHVRGQLDIPNKSKYTVVEVDCYSNIKSYLSEVSNTDIRSLEDIIAYNNANDGTEGGRPWPFGIPAF